MVSLTGCLTRLWLDKMVAIWKKKKEYYCHVAILKLRGIVGIWPQDRWWLEHDQVVQHHCHFNLHQKTIFLPYCTDLTISKWLTGINKQMDQQASKCAKKRHINQFQNRNPSHFKPRSDGDYLHQYTEHSVAQIIDFVDTDWHTSYI